MPQTDSEKEIKIGEMDIDLDKQVRNQLLEDRVKVEGAILELIKTGSNCFVVGEHYLCPTIIANKKVEINHEYGEFQYFSRIRQALEYALIIGKIPREIKLPETIPPYLKELIE